MMTALIGLLMEMFVAILLVASIYYSVKLNQRLNAMRDGRDGIKEAVEQLNAATEKARRSIAELRQAADAMGNDLQSRVQTGRALADELGMIVATGDALANRLEQRLSGGAVQAAMAAAQAPRGPDPKAADPMGERAVKADPPLDEDDAGKSDTERELLRALKAAR